MKMQRLMSRILCLALAASAAGSAHAAVRMSVTAETRNQPNPDAKAPPGGTRQSDVVLADTYISSRTGNKTVVFDFAQRRLADGAAGASQPRLQLSSGLGRQHGRAEDP